MSTHTLLNRLRDNRNRLKVPELPVEGRLSTLRGLTLEASGCKASMGSRCVIETTVGSGIEAQVVGFNNDRTLLMPMGSVDGLRSQARVIPVAGQLDAPVGDALLGRVIDARAQPIDGLGPVLCSRTTPLNPACLNPLERSGISEQFDVGVRAINGLLTLGRGQRVGLFAGSGVGKSEQEE